MDRSGVDNPAEAAGATSRKRSVAWCFFKPLSPRSVQCLLCSGLQAKQQGSTTTMLRHLRLKHPREVARKFRGQASEAVHTNGHQGAHTDREQLCSVESALEDCDSDIHETMNESVISSAVTGMAAQGDPAELAAQGETLDDGDNRPVRCTRHKRSLIWRHYERLDSLNAARCLICMKKLQCTENGGTSNLRRHMLKRHPEVFARLVADGLKPFPPDSSHGSNANGDTSTEQRQHSGVLPGSRAFEGEKRVLRREQELIEALRRTQKEEARALEHQRELLEKLRAADAREAAAEWKKIESLRTAQQEEAKELGRQREELQKEKTALQKKWDELQQEREELLLFSRGQ
ncbi:uncharacterized protein LOC117757668 [Hippoglossus hippoglossus]|uniref:uncharacterized protein LOC117757668 n=1 Tax=Hippoglossus hippoglossus TaxID=8267 RepID=UPI00148E51FC|nr:uncharacterized protein LOC117757668 [Hippoglossus hippoglossus]